MDHILPLDIGFDYNGAQQHIYPVILKDDNEALLVDCGYPKFMPLIEAAAMLHGFELKSLTGLIITHHDLDHMGTAKELKQKYPALKIYSSAADKPYIEGSKKSLRLEQAEAMLPTLPEDQKEWGIGFIQRLQTLQPVAVDVSLEDGQILPVGTGIEIIYTPGHMPGHISLYHRQSKTLIAADALVYENGALGIANPAFTLDIKSAVGSIMKLLEYDIQRIICYHGGTVEHRIQEDIKRIINQYS